MAFSNQDRINLVTKSIAAGVIDANSASQWYETIFPFTFNLNADAVFTQLSTVRQYPASNRTQARDNVANHLSGIVQDYSQPADAVQLTAVAGTNNTTYAAYIGGDPANGVLNNWLLPQLVPQAGGMASNGYGVLLYDGDPNNGGTVIATTFADNSPTTGPTKSVGWLFNYSNGLLLVSDDFKTALPNFDPYILAFRYIGGTAQTISDDLAIVKSDLLALTTAFDNYKVTTDDRLTILEADLATNTTNIATNATNIATNATDIATNAADIATNATDIATNAADIATRVGGASNEGTGTGLFAQKSGSTLQFKTLQAGSNIRIDDDGQTVTITAEGGGRATGLIARFVKGG